MPPNPYHEDTSTRFNKEYEQPLGQLAKGAENPSNISGARSARYFSDEKYLAKGERGRKALMRRQALTYYNGEQADQNYQNNPTKQPSEAKKAGILKTSLNENLGRIRSIPLGAEILVWSIPYYLFIQLPLLILANISFGLAWGITYYSSGKTGIIDPILKGSGLGFEAFMVLYLGLTGIVVFFTYIQLFVGILQFKLAFLHPLFGERGSTSKFGGFLLVMIGTWIPLVNIFPFFFLWLLAAVINPR